MLEGGLEGKSKDAVESKGKKESEDRELSSFRDIATEWDKDYAKQNGLTVSSEAIRVEQGEYVVTPQDIEIGTFNVRQCAVLYVRNLKTGLHGMAHIDGHTEINSLEEFFSKFKAGKGELEVTLFGASLSEMSMGLNDPTQNANKVKTLLEKHRVLLKEQNIDGIISSRRVELRDFIIDRTGEARKGLAAGGATEHRALHAIQEVRRRDAYIGCYTIIEAYHPTNTIIYLDERAIFKLKEYEQDRSKDQKTRHEMDNSNYREYDAAIPEILTAWNQTINDIMGQAKPLKIIDAEPDSNIREILKRTPLYIGHDSAVRNKEIIAILKTVTSIEDLELRLRSIVQSKSNSTILQAIAVAVEYDKGLDKEAFLRSLTEYYNSKYNPKPLLSSKEILNKSYGAEISVEEFNNLLSKHSPKLSALMTLNSQAGYCISERRPYTIRDALGSAGVIHPAFREILSKRMEEYNSSIEVQLEKGDFEQALEFAMEVAGVEKGKQKIPKVRLSQAGINSQSAFETFIAERIPEAQMQLVLENARQKLQDIRSIKKRDLMITLDSPYRKLQEEFLATVRGQFPDFNAFTISKDIASSKFQRQASLEEKSPKKGEEEQARESGDLRPTQKPTPKPEQQSSSQGRSDKSKDGEDEKSKKELPKRKIVLALAFVATMAVIAFKWRKKSLKRSEKEALKEATGIEDYQFRYELLKANNESQKKLISMLELTPETELPKPKTKGIGKIALIPEDDHIKDHSKHIDKLIAEIRSRTREENQREVIVLERKELGKNLGMKDVILLAKIIKHNETNAEKIALPKGIEGSAIYHDARLYLVAKEHGVKVLGAEGTGLQYSQRDEKYNEERENYMVKRMSELLEQGYNVSMPVGSSHVQRIERDLDKFREFRTVGLHTQHLAVDKIAAPQATPQSHVHR